MKKGMGLFGGLVLMLFVNSAKAGNEFDAQKAFVNATVKQLGIDNAVNEFVKKYLPEKYIKWAEQAAPAIQAVQTGSIQLVWEIE